MISMFIYMIDVCNASSKITTNFNYTISVNENLETAERVATSLALQEVIEKIYVNIESTSEVVNSQISKDVVLAISAAIIKIDKKTVKKIDDNHLTIQLEASYDDDISTILNRYKEDTTYLIEYEKLKDKFIEYREKIDEKKQRLKKLSKNIDSEYINDEIKDIDNNFLASIWFEKGLIQFHIGNDNEAIISFDTALAFNPKYENAYAAKGMVYHKKNEINIAIDEYQKALDIRNDYYEVLHMMGLIYKRLGDYNKSLYYLTRSIQSNPYSTATLNLRASVYVVINQYTYAVNDYKEAIRLNYRDLDALVGLSMTLSNINDYNSSLLWANRAIENHPQKFEGYMAKSMVLAYMGQVKESIRYLDTAISLCKDADYLTRLADLRKVLISN